MWLNDLGWKKETETTSIKYYMDDNDICHFIPKSPQIVWLAVKYMDQGH